MRHLYLYHTDTHGSLDQLHNLTSLTSLDLSHTDAHGDTAPLRDAIPGLSTLGFSSCAELSRGCSAGSLLPAAYAGRSEEACCATCGGRTRSRTA